MTRLALLVSLLIGLSACNGASKLFGHLDDPEAYWLPLTVDLRMDPSVTDAALDYTDACRQSQTLSFGERLKDSLRREMAQAFEKVREVPVAASSRIADGAIDVALGLKELDLFIPSQQTKSYTATVTLGATVTYADPSGSVLYAKNLRTSASGDVETEKQSCEVTGLAKLVNQAAGMLAQGLKKTVATSTKIKEAAQAKQASPQAVSSASVSDTGVSMPSTGIDPQPPPYLSFRVMFKDGNQNQRLESGEAVIVEVEVTNTGPEVARGVEIILSGTPLLLEQLPGHVPVGDMQPRETRTQHIEGISPRLVEAQQAELIIDVQSSASAIRPKQKIFQVALHPSADAEPEVVSVDVDRIPDGLAEYERPNTVAIAIGVGSFRSADIPGVQFAARDASVMAEYLRAVAGVPSKRIKLLTDDHALKDDLVEVVEQWLPQHTTPGGIVFIFISGRALINPSNGSVSIIPHEADSGSSHRLFSLRRLYDALARLPIQHAVVLMDLTVTSPEAGERGKDPAWSAVPLSLRGDKMVQVIGIHGRQEAHQYEPGRHGLFTYYVLKALGGDADHDHNGSVALGELCEYVHERVLQAARDKFQNAQEPACLPHPDPQAKSWSLPLARVKRGQAGID